VNTCLSAHSTPHEVHVITRPRLTFLWRKINAPYSFPKHLSQVQLEIWACGLVGEMRNALRALFARPLGFPFRRLGRRWLWGTEVDETGSVPCSVVPFILAVLNLWLVPPVLVICRFVKELIEQTVKGRWVCGWMDWWTQRKKERKKERIWCREKLFCLVVNGLCTVRPSLEFIVSYVIVVFFKCLWVH
jgi:hypothetical protein